jgi:uncharacterized membrane protein
MNHRVHASVLFAVGLGFFLRLYNIRGPSLWTDELMTAGRIAGSLTEVVKGLFNSDFPPFYYILLNLWVKCFGISEMTLRFPSLLFSALSIFAIYKFTKRLLGEKVGLISALLLSVSPYSIHYAQEAKMYAMLWFLGIASFYFFYKFTQDDKISTLSFHVIFTLLSIYTLYVGFVFIAVENILYFFLFRGRNVKTWIAGQLLILFFYLPWFNIFLFNAVHRPGIAWIPQIENHIHACFISFGSVTGISMSGQPPIRYFFYCLYAFLMISAVVSRNARQGGKLSFRLFAEEYFLLAWMIAPVLSELGLPDGFLQDLKTARGGSDGYGFCYPFAVSSHSKT